MTLNILKALGNNSSTNMFPHIHYETVLFVDKYLLFGCMDLIDIQQVTAQEDLISNITRHIYEE
jgi:hypothetical protein